MVYSQGDMFRPSLGHLQALKETKIHDYIDFVQKCIVGSQMLAECYRGTVWIVEYMCL